MSVEVTCGTATVTVEPSVSLRSADGRLAENYDPRDLAQAVAAVVRSWGNLSPRTFYEMMAASQVPALGDAPARPTSPEFEAALDEVRTMETQARERSQYDWLQAVRRLLAAADALPTFQRRPL